MTSPSQSNEQQPKLRVLCADDNAWLRYVVVQLLTTAGHIAEPASDGFEAWNILASDLTRFDVLVTDHEMPGLRGTELVELLRQTSFAGRIIVYTSSRSDHLGANYRALRVDAIVEKSTNAETL